MSNKYISTTCLPDNTPIEDAIKMLIDLDYKQIELGSTHPFEKNVKAILKKYNLKYLVHNYFPTPEKNLIVNICAEDKSIRMRSINHVIERIKFSKEIGAELFTFHPGYISQPVSTNIDSSNWDFVYDRGKNKPTHYSKAFKLLIDAIKVFVDIAEKEKQKIALETTGSIKQSNNLLMQKMNEFDTLFNQINSDYFGINLNIGHLNLASKYFGFKRREFVNLLKNKIFAFELSHNDRKQDDHALLKKGEWYWSIIEDNNFVNTPMIYEGRETNLISFEHLWSINK